MYNILIVLYIEKCKIILKYGEVICLRELFIEKVIDESVNFLENNQRIKLKEILEEICLNYQIEMLEQTESKSNKKSKRNINR